MFGSIFSIIVNDRIFPRLRNDWKLHRIWIRSKNFGKWANRVATALAFPDREKGIFAVTRKDLETHFDC